MLANIEDEEEVGLDPDLGEGEDGIDEVEREEKKKRKKDQGSGGIPSSAASTEEGTFKQLHRKLKELKDDIGDHALVGEAEEGDGEEGREKGGPAGEKASARLARQRAEVQKLLEEYYKLDYEDNIGGLKTRFRYREVPAQQFGLSAEDILSRSDRELNQAGGLGAPLPLPLRD